MRCKLHLKFHGISGKLCWIVIFIFWVLLHLNSVLEARAGRGGSYRGSSSSSSTRSSSSSSYRSYGSSSSSSYKSSSSSSYGSGSSGRSTSNYVPEFSHFTEENLSFKLNINRDGTLSVTEEFTIDPNYYKGKMQRVLVDQGGKILIKEESGSVGPDISFIEKSQKFIWKIPVPGIPKVGITVDKHKTIKPVVSANTAPIKIRLKYKISGALLWGKDNYQLAYSPVTTFYKRISVEVEMPQEDLKPRILLIPHNETNNIIGIQMLPFDVPSVSQGKNHVYQITPEILPKKSPISAAVPLILANIPSKYFTENAKLNAIKKFNRGFAKNHKGEIERIIQIDKNRVVHNTLKMKLSDNIFTNAPYATRMKFQKSDFIKTSGAYLYPEPTTIYLRGAGDFISRGSWSSSGYYTISAYLNRRPGAQKTEEYRYSMLGAIYPNESKTEILSLWLTYPDDMGYRTSYGILNEKEIIVRTPSFLQAKDIKILLSKIEMNYRYQNSDDPVYRYPVNYRSEIINNELIIRPDQELHPDELLLLTLEYPSTGFESPSWFTRRAFDISTLLTFLEGPYWPIYLIAVFLLGIIVWLIFLYYKRKKQAADEAITAKRKLRQDEILIAVQKADPEFNLEAFFARVKMIFERIQDSWSKADMRFVRRYVSQGVYNRFRLQLQMMRSDEGLADIVTDYKVNALWIDSLEITGKYQSLHVHISAQCRNAEVKSSLTFQESLAVAEKKPIEEFEEIYSFIRKKSAKGGVLTNTGCPKCGAPEPEKSEINKCGNCGYLYGSGEYDWVLSEITQKEEWPLRYPITETDRASEGFCSQVVEDRASYLFWKHLYGNTRPSVSMNRDLTDNMLKHMKIKGKPVFQPVVGGISLKKLEKTAEGEYRATVRVDNSYADLAGAEPKYRGKEFILVTNISAETSSLADHSCTTCGAPLPETDTEKCSYCGSTLPGKVHDWLLDEIK